MSYSGVQPQYGTFPSDLFTGNGSNTVFTMSSVPGNDAALLVTVDGVRQHTDTYSYTANTLTFSEAPGSGAIIETVNMGSRADIIITEGVYKKTQFTATAAQTNFTIGTGYTVGFVDVYLNGIRLVVADDFTATDGSTIILATPAASGDAVEVVAYGTFNVANALLKSGDTMSGNLVVSGTTTMLSPVAVANTTGNTFVIANTGAVTITGTLTASANVNFDSGTLFVDGTNNRVGINTTSPSAVLHIEQASDNLLDLNSTSTFNPLIQFKKAGTRVAYIQPTVNSLNIAGETGSSNTVAFITGTTERMKIDGSGRVTLPYQPSFFVSDINSSTTNQTELIFTAVSAYGRHNTGSHYSTSTGRFTAPIAGYYLMSYSARGNSTTNYFHPSFRINGVDITHTRMIWGGSLDYKSLSYSATFYLASGDYVSVSTAVSGGGIGGTLESGQCSFSGRLVG
jgi:hypothetical protein